MRHLILEYLIRQLLSEEEFTSLNIKSFIDRGTRTNTFVDALSNGTALTLAKGADKVTVGSVEVVKDGKTTYYDPKTQAAELKAILPTLAARDKLYLYTGKLTPDAKSGIDKPSGKRFSITAVAKTTELGGKGKGGTLGPERAAIASIQKQLDGIGKPVTIVLDKYVFDNIDGITNVKENQKADFALTSKGEPVAFLSYKPGNNPKGMISYGGITAISAKSRDVQNFIAAIKKKVTSLKGLGYEFGVPLNDKGVALRAMYGSNFGGDYGLNNVQAIVQGDIKLVKVSDDKYALTADHILASPTIPTDDYAPYLNARYASDRNQFDIENCRVGIVPVGARSNIKSPFEKNVQAKPTT